MPKPLPFTEASLSRAIKGVEKAGLFVIGVRSDGTLIVADKPIDPTSIVPSDAQPSSPEAAEGRRMGDYFHGGSGEA
jgi:hypothetical protein